MKCAWLKVDVAPQKPVHKFAPLGKGILTATTKDELACKISMMENDDGSLYIHISFPFGEVTNKYYAELKENLQKAVQKKITLTTVVTHTHYAPKMEQEIEYGAWVMKRVCEAAAQAKLVKYDALECSYQRCHFDQVGKVRISGEESPDVYIELFSIFNEGKRIATYIIYNSHPTTQSFNENYFSGAGPAVLMKDLEQLHHGEFYSYMVGAAGDISTRFTRKGQTYQDMLDLNQIVEDKINEMLKEQNTAVQYKVTEWREEEQIFHVKHTPKDMTMIDSSGEMTPREKETLEIAKEKGRSLNLAERPTEYVIQKVTLGGHIFIYTPFELFSSYLESIDLEHSSLMNLSNGQAQYLSGPGIQKLSFEVLNETISDPYKKDLQKLLYQMTHEGDNL